MNRSINILLVFFSFPAFAFIICVAFDIHFFNIPLAELPFKFHIFIGIATLLLLLIIQGVGLGITHFLQEGGKVGAASAAGLSGCGGSAAEAGGDAGVGSVIMRGL